MRRSLPLILLLAALGLLAWSVLGGRDDAGPRSPSAGAASGDAPGTPAPAAVEAPAETPAREELAPAAGEEAAGEGRPFSPQPGPGEDALLVQVVAGDGRTPVPGAIVYALTEDLAGERGAEEAMRRGGDPFTLLRRLGDRFLADGEGRARLPFSGKELLLAGDAPGLSGLLMLEEPPAGGPVILRLEKRAEIQVEVRDAAGRPAAGVPLGLVLVDDSGLTGVSFPVQRTRTDAQGRARLGNLEQAFRVRRNRALELRVLAPFEEPPGLRLDPQTLPADTVVLELPPSGSVVAEVLDENGRPADDGVSVDLAIHREAGAARFLPAGRPGMAPEAVQDGRARFPWVGLGLDLVASARLPAHPAPTETRFQGPSAPGEEVTVRVQAETGGVWLTGRILDPEGKPVRRERLRVTLALESGFGSSRTGSRVRTDGEGRFRYALDTEGGLPEARRRLEFRRGPRGPRVTVELAPTLPPGTHDLGDLILRAPQVLAEGRVVDPLGQPVAGAHVGLQLASDDPDELWTLTLERPSVRTGEDGTFTLQGEPELYTGLETTLRVTHSEYPAKEWPLILGSTGLVLSLDTGSGLRGSVLVDEDVDPSNLFISFIEETGRRERPGWEGREFVWKALEAERGAVEILDQARQTVLEAPDIVLARGQETRDPRLQEIDLRGRLRPVVLQVLDGEGRPLAGARALAYPGEEGLPMLHRSGGDGRVSILCLGPLPRVVVGAEGRIAVEERQVSGELEVRLLPAAEVELRLDGLPTLPEGMSLGLMLQHEGPDTLHNPAPDPQGVFDGGGRLVLRLPMAGTWRITGIVFQRLGNGGTIGNGAAGLLLPETFEIADPARPTSVRLAVDPEVLEEVLGGF